MFIFKGYTDILKRQYPDKRVHANVVYQQYIGYKEHVHMNSTVWVTLTSFIKHLGRTGDAVVDETEKGNTQSINTYYLCLNSSRTSAVLGLINTDSSSLSQTVAWMSHQGGNSRERVDYKN